MAVSEEQNRHWQNPRIYGDDSFTFAHIEAVEILKESESSIWSKFWAIGVDSEDWKRYLSLLHSQNIAPSLGAFL